MGNRGRLIGLLGTDLLLVIAGVFLAFVSRFEGQVPVGTWYPLWPTFAPTAAIFLLSFYVFRLYHRAWRFAGVETILSVVKATTAGTFAMAVLQYGFYLTSFPRSVLVLSWLWIVFLVGASRIALRLAYSYRAKRANGDKAGHDRPVLVIGAGEAGAMIVDAMNKHPEMCYRPIGLIDDDPEKRNTYVRGIRVLGPRSDLPRLLSQNGVAEVVIAMPSAPASVLRSIVEECQKFQVPTKTLPGLVELITKGMGVHALRTVRVEDLLQRPSIRGDLSVGASQINGKVVLITGAGGSIGSELARQVMARLPKKLLLLGHGENSIHDIYCELSESGRANGQRLIPIIADIQDSKRIDHLFARYQPNLVFHVAAHKHVPLMELNPAEAVKNNIIGTCNVMDAASKCGTSKFVLVSTDKAANPCSVMGATKRIAEMLVQSRSNSDGTEFVAVRFGNVLGSRGSVVPAFKRQIESGGPVQITHEEMTRYFMTIPEAVFLILQAASLGSNGGLFLLNMGKPIRIVDLAKEVIRFYGLEPGTEMPIVVTGIRPGEKLHEELVGDGERTEPTEDKNLMRIKASHPDGETLRQAVSELAELAARGDEEQLLQRLGEIIPEYQPNAQLTKEINPL